jgi:hypothetical protein
MYLVKLTDAEVKFMNYLQTFGEIARVGVGLGGGFESAVKQK